MVAAVPVSAVRLLTERALCQEVFFTVEYCLIYFHLLWGFSNPYAPSPPVKTKKNIRLLPTGSQLLLAERFSPT